MDTQTLSRWGHRLLTAEDGSRRTLTGSVDGAPRWVAGLAAGVQAAVLSLAVVVVPTVAAYVATSADPSNQDVGWLRAVGVGGGLWLLGHGAPLDLGGVRVSLMPLGLTALALFACYASARRSGLATRAGYAVGVSGYVLIAMLVALLSGHSGLLRTAVGSALVAAVGLGAGLLAQPGSRSLRDVTRPVRRRLPAPVLVGLAGGVMASAALVVVSSGLVVGWLVARRDSIGDVSTSLGVDLVGGVALALVQLALLPDLVVWALAYVAGPGFVVGAGTHMTAAEVVSGPLPALPLLGALPEPGSNPWTAWWPLITVILGAGVGWWLHTRLQRGEWWYPLVACVTAAGAAALTAGVLAALASGSAGPGRMAEVGASGVLVGAAVGLGTLVGAALVALPFNPEVRSEAYRRWRQVRARDRVVTAAVPVAVPAGDDIPGDEDDDESLEADGADEYGDDGGHVHRGDAADAGAADADSTTGDDLPAEVDARAGNDVEDRSSATSR